MRYRILALLALLSSVVAAPLQAAVVRDLYEARVNVGEQSPAELKRAARDGLAEVLVRVSGRTDAAPYRIYVFNPQDRHETLPLGESLLRFVDAPGTRNTYTFELAQATGGSSRRIGHESGSAVSVPRIVPVRSGSQFAGNDWIGLRISDSGIVRGVQISPLFVGLLGLAILFGALVAGWLGESGRRFRRQA